MPKEEVQCEKSLIEAETVIPSTNETAFDDADLKKMCASFNVEATNQDLAQ